MAHKLEGNILTLSGPKKQRIHLDDDNFQTFLEQEEALHKKEDESSDTPTSTSSSQPPAGATLISGPSGLQGLTESQIWRDPNSDKIYKLQQAPAPATAPASGDSGQAPPGMSTTPPTGNQRFNPPDFIAPDGTKFWKVEETQATTEDEASNALIENSGLPDDSQTLAKVVIDAFPADTEISDEEILNVFRQIETDFIDPHFSSIISQTKADIELAIERGAEERAIQEQVERENALERVRQSQRGLEASGLTFSGAGARQLGSQSAIRGETRTGVIPLLNKRIQQGSRRQFNRGLQDIGIAGEKQLGTANISGLVPGFVPRGSVSGQIPFQQQQFKGQVLGSLIGSQRDLEAKKRLFTATGVPIL